MGRSPQRYPTTTKVESHEAWREHLAVSPATSPQAIPMAAHAEHTVHPRQPDCHTLMASVTGPAAPAHPAYEVARPWWRRLWALGAARRRRCVVPRAALRPAEPLTAPDGRRRTSQAQRPPPASAGCGPGRVGRQDGPGPGPTGLWPLDAALRVPARGSAARWRAGAASGTTAASSRARQTVRERLLGLSLRLPARATSRGAAARAVPPFSDQPPTRPPPVTGGTSLGGPAEGTGVPRGPPATAPPAVRLGTGPTHPTQPAAVVTGLSPSAPDPRTPPAVGAARLQEPARPVRAAPPRPSGPARHAPLEGPAVAMTRRVPRVARRDARSIPPPVARPEGAEARPQQVLSHVPPPTLGWESIHATAYRWDTAHALRGDPHPGRTTGVRTPLAPGRAGPTDTVRTARVAEAHAPRRPETPRRAVLRTGGSDHRNRPSLPDDASLARGGPLGTGVVEGACRHRVPERLEPSGMRWTPAGAQAVLALRAVRITGHWEASGSFHRPQHHQRVYGTSAPVPERAEAQGLPLVASCSHRPQIVVTLI